MADSEEKVVIVNIASLSEEDSDGTVEIVTKKKRTPSKSNGNLSNSESRWYKDDGLFEYTF